MKINLTPELTLRLEEIKIRVAENVENKKNLEKQIKQWIDDVFEANEDANPFKIAYWVLKIIRQIKKKYHCKI